MELKPEGEFAGGKDAATAKAKSMKGQELVRVVAIRPIYHTPGATPVAPGELVDCDPVTAKYWVERGIVRYPGDEGISASITADTGKVVSAPLAPAPEMVPPPVQPS